MGPPGSRKFSRTNAHFDGLLGSSSDEESTIMDAPTQETYDSMFDSEQSPRVKGKKKSPFKHQKPQDKVLSAKTSPKPKPKTASAAVRQVEQPHAEEPPSVPQPSAMGGDDDDNDPPPSDDGNDSDTSDTTNNSDDAMSDIDEPPVMKRLTSSQKEEHIVDFVQSMVEKEDSQRKREAMLKKMQDELDRQRLAISAEKVLLMDDSVFDAVRENVSEAMRKMVRCQMWDLVMTGRNRKQRQELLSVLTLINIKSHTNMCIVLH